MKSRKDGFTLVELIVVIAILGILSGVGTVAYSGYIKRANQAADEVMISGIKTALALGVQAGHYPQGDLGLVVVKDSGASVKETTSLTDGTPVADMMETAYGAGWEDTLKLKSNLTGGSYDDYKAMVEAVTRATDGFEGYINSVPNSTFYPSAGTDDTGALMSEVTDVVKSFSTALGTKELSNAMKSLWSSGFTTSLGGKNINIEDFSDSNDDKIKAANLTVWAAANGIKNVDKSTRDSWISTWNDQSSGGFAVTQGSTIAPVVLAYAQLNALAKYADQKKPGTYENVYQRKLNQLQNAENVSDYFTKLSEIRTSIIDVLPTADKSSYWASQADGTSQATKDAEAFLATMAALNSLEGSYVTKDNLDSFNDPNFFGNEDIASTLSHFVTACSNAELLAGMENTDGCIIFVGVGKNGQPVIS